MSSPGERARAGAPLRWRRLLSACCPSGGLAAGANLASRPASRHVCSWSLLSPATFVLLLGFGLVAHGFGDSFSPLAGGLKQTNWRTGRLAGPWVASCFCGLAVSQ